MYELLENCPICHKHSAVLVSINGTRNQNSPHFVYCSHCRAKTFNFINARDAVITWNKACEIEAFKK